MIDLPPELDTDEFRAAWRDWEQHRKEKRQRLTDLSVRLQVKKLSAMGVERAIQSIVQSIENGWTGLFEPRGAGGKPRQSVPTEADWAEQARDRDRREAAFRAGLEAEANEHGGRIPV